MEDDSKANCEASCDTVIGLAFGVICRGVCECCVEMGGDMSINRLTGPCIGCHVAQQLKQRHRVTAGPSRGHPSALNGLLDSTGYR